MIKREISYIKDLSLIACIVCVIILISGCQKIEPLKEEEQTAETTYKCLIVASYHEGYAGQDVVVEGIYEELKDGFEIEQFNMDTKNNPQKEYAEKKAIEVKEYIDSWQPDIVIALDDNASKYVIMPYFNDVDLPIVFAGVNWSAQAYGYPYSNVTGMIEVHPISQALKEVKSILPKVNMGSCIYPDTESDAKHFEEFNKIMTVMGLKVEGYKVSNVEEFKEAFIQAQSSDFIMFTNNVGISNWDDVIMKSWILKQTKIMTLSTNPWMTPYVATTFSMDSKEQGSYAGQVVKKIIIEGVRPIDIPIVSNRNYSLLINEILSKKANLVFTEDFYQKAIKLD